MSKNRRELKREVLALLESEDLPSLCQKIVRYPLRQVINPLIGALCREEVIRFKAVAAIGQVVARLADSDREAARVIIRRFMWMLNEESGGMAWGVPEAMAESLAHHRGLAEEYTSILIAYIWPEGNYLEYPPAQRGVVWGIGRLADFHPDLLKRFEAPKHLLHLLSSEDQVVKGLCLWAYQKMGKDLLEPVLPQLIDSLRQISLSRVEILLLDDLEIKTLVIDQNVLETLLQHLLTKN